MSNRRRGHSPARTLPENIQGGGSTADSLCMCESLTYITEKVEGLCQSYIQHANTLSKQLVQMLTEVLVKREFENEEKEKNMKKKNYVVHS